jgi:hypothetical protein
VSIISLSVAISLDVVLVTGPEQLQNASMQGRKVQNLKDALASLQNARA